MYQGMYNLTSSMLTQRRKLDVTGNNMVNLQTPGYKSEILVSETFKEAMYTQTHYYNKKNDRTIGTTSYIRAARKTFTDFSEGTLSETENPLDLAIQGKGFFSVRDAEGNVRYTRSGLFKTDQREDLF